VILCQVQSTVNWKRPKTGTEAKNVALSCHDPQSFDNPKLGWHFGNLRVGGEFGVIPSRPDSGPKFGP